jgi:hypothetical protein
MSQEELQETRDTLSLLSATELRGMLGSGDEEDVIINELLGAGSAKEVKGGASADEDADDLPPVDGNEDDGEDETDDDQDDDGADDQGDQDAAAAQDAADEAARAQAAADAAAAAAAAPAAPAPLDLSFLDTEYKAKLDALTAKKTADLAALNAEKAAKFKEMMEGTLDAGEYAEYETGYLDQRDALNTAATVGAESLRQAIAADASLLTAAHAVKAQALAETGVNYDADPDKFQAWDDWIKRLAANPANAKLSDTELLTLAHKKVLVEFEIAPRAAAAAPAKPAKPGARAPRLDNLPPTLANLPAASAATAGDEGEFAHLDKLSGMAYEQAIARMTPEQQARYEAS